MNNIRMAWRNLWRNRRRTTITMASIFFGVLFSTIMTSMQEGMYGRMIDNIVKFYTGYLQIQHPDYQDKKTINHTFQPADSVYRSLRAIKEVSQFVPRLESFTLISIGDETKGGALIGIDPEQENKLTGLKKWVKKGQYLTPGSDGILLTANLARNLDVKIGDTLILLSQGYHGASAEGLFPLQGILEFPSPQLNNMGGYVTLEKAREFYWTGDRVTSIVVMLQNHNDLPGVNQSLQSRFGDHYGIQTWNEMQPDLKQMIQADRAGALVMKAILYMLIGFGILGTIIMMLSERRKEIGVMIAIGMKKQKLIQIMIYETVMIGILGVIAGFIGSIPVIAFFVNNPIPFPEEAARSFAEFGWEPVIYFSSRLPVFTNQVLTVFLITLAISIYPMMHILRLRAVNALRT
ncbi:MAG: ABC transporter permease [Bacteroidales bacterium]|nr:ABC transporter permease [Bacteroidales bacterium]